MQRERFLLMLTIFFCLYKHTFAQNPPDIDWKYIKTNHFKVIFPSEIEADAQRIANTLEWVYPRNTKSLNIKPRLVPLVINSHSMTSNAQAQLGPRMMGWYLTPPQSVNNLGSIDWIQTLSIHEFRHIVQYAKNKQNFTKFMSLIYGDIGQGMMRWTIPDWFYEGDAVAMETALTKGGRGRMPEFDMAIRTFTLNKEKYSYDQAYLGSYKRYYPSHYHLGYPLISYARVNYGIDVWDKTLDRTSKIPFMPFAFGGSLKKYTNLNVNKLYKATMNDLKEKWEKEAGQLKTTDAKIVNLKKKNCWTSYIHPKYDKNGNIICIKQDLKNFPAFYIISPNGSEKKIQTTDAETFSLKNDLLCWDRTIPDIRWSEQSFSDIMIYGQQSQVTRQLTSKKKYMSPAISPDGKYIAAVEHSENQKNRLCLIDASGQEKKSYDIGNNDYIRMPSWSEDGKLIAFTHSNLNGNALSILDIETGKITNILNYSFENIGEAIFYEHYILYNSPYSGISNIYAVDIETGQKYQVTSRPYGAFNADISPDKTKMVFQDFNKNGYDIAEMALKPENWIKIEEIRPTEQHYLKKLIEQEGGKTVNDTTMSQTVFPVNKYNKFSDGIKIHSWGIFPYMPNLEFNLYSDNYLGTMKAQAGYIYDTNEGTNTGYLGFSYSRYFPIITITSSYGQRKDTYKLPAGTTSDQWEEFRTGLTISLPLNLSRNTNYTSLSIRGGYTFVNTYNKLDIRRLSATPNGLINILNAEISFINQSQYAWRDFNPRFGQYVYLDYKQIPSVDDYNGYLFSTHCNLFFPGILPQNSIKLGASFEKQLTFDQNNYAKTYYFSSLSSFPRGFSATTFDNFYKFSADYQFPVCYPDLSFGPLVYLKRIRAGVFSDSAQGNFGTNSYSYQSFGGSLLFEIQFFRYKYPLEIGLQYSYKAKNPQGDGQNDFSILIFGLPF